MDKRKTFIKSTIVYFAGNVLMKLMTFILLPIYTNYLSKTDIGIYEEAVSVVTFFAMTIFLNIWSTILRYMYEYQERHEKSKAINNGLFITFVSFFLYTFLFYIYNYFVPVNQAIYVYLYGVFTILHYIYGNIARGYGKNVLYALSGVLASLITLLTNIFLIVFLNFGIESLYISVVIGYLLQIFIIEWKLRILSSFKKRDLSKTILISYLKFSIPISISTLISWFLDGYNKVYISQNMGYSENGLYSVAGKFSGALSLIASVIILAWQEMAFKNAESENVSEKNTTYSTAINSYLYYMTYGIALLLPAISIVFPYLIKKDFIESYPYVPFHIFGTALSTFMNFYSQIFFADKKTISVTLSFGIAALTNFLLLPKLLLALGIQGANLSIIIIYILGLLCMYMATRKTISLKFLSLKNILGFVLLFLGYWVYTYNSLIISLIFIIIGIGLFLYSEKQNVLLLKDLIKKRN